MAVWRFGGRHTTSLSFFENDTVLPGALGTVRCLSFFEKIHTAARAPLPSTQLSRSNQFDGRKKFRKLDKKEIFFVTAAILSKVS